MVTLIKQTIPLKTSNGKVMQKPIDHYTNFYLNQMCRQKLARPGGWYFVCECYQTLIEEIRLIQHQLFNSTGDRKFPTGL